MALNFFSRPSALVTALFREAVLPLMRTTRLASVAIPKKIPPGSGVIVTARPRLFQSSSSPKTGQRKGAGDSRPYLRRLPLTLFCVFALSSAVFRSTSSNLCQAIHSPIS